MLVPCLDVSLQRIFSQNFTVKLLNVQNTQNNCTVNTHMPAILDLRLNHLINILIYLLYSLTVHLSIIVYPFVNPSNSAEAAFTQDFDKTGRPF